MTDPAFSPELEAVLAAAAPLAVRFAGAGHRLYLVGGVVRDHLTGRSRGEEDLDATTDARPAQIKAVVAAVADAVWTQGERFGTIGCVVDGRTWEITTHRAESYDGDSRKPSVTFGDRIEDDLARRDFTVNAMAIDLADRSLVDPHGGRDDLRLGVLRTPLDPEVSFSEDPLRMLRAARFHASDGLVPVPALTAALSAMADRLAIVSAERIRDEIQKLILLDDPTPGLRLLVETGLLSAAVPVLGGVDVVDAATIGARVAAVPADPAMRWAALLLDVGIGAADLRGLVFSGTLTAETIWFASSPLARGSTEVGGSDADVRRAAAGAPSGRRLEDQLDFAHGIWTTNRWPTEPLVEWRRALERLREAESDLDDPTPLLTGDEVKELLALDPGPDVGLALRWLRDLRFDRGPVPVAEARRLLTEWWPTRDLG